MMNYMKSSPLIWKLSREGVSGTDFPIYNYRYHYSNNIRNMDFSLLSK